MVKKIMMTLVLSTLLNVGHSFAMEKENTNPDTVDRIAGIILDFGIQEDNAETRDIILNALQNMGMTANDEEIRKAFMKGGSEGKQMPQKKETGEGTLRKVPKDVQSVTGQTLHEAIANPVLDGELVYKDNGKETHFKIKNLVKEDGSIDLSNKDIFGDASEHLLITTDPEKFFSINKDSKRLVYLIAPRFLIEEKIESTAKHFKPIMDKWNVNQAPIGMFWRMEKWENLGWYDYLTTSNLVSISKNNVYGNNSESATTVISTAAPISSLALHFSRNLAFIFK